MSFADYEADVTEAIQNWCETLAVKLKSNSASEIVSLQDEANSQKEIAANLIRSWKMSFPSKVTRIEKIVNELTGTFMPEVK